MASILKVVSRKGRNKGINDPAWESDKSGKGIPVPSLSYFYLLLYHITMFTGIDIIGAILVLSGALLGLIRGFVGGFLDLLGITAGISLASIAYRAPVNLLIKFNIRGNAVELVCFLATSLILVMAMVILLDVLRKRVDVKHIVDRLFGILPGVIEGFVFAGLLFLTMSISFDSAMDIQHSRLHSYILKFMPRVYEKTDRIGINLPKMIYLPKKYADEFNPENKEIRFCRINFSRFEGFTCMECGGKVRFEGYFLRIGATMVPKLVCTICGRTSDGCQTYEGFHRLYGGCPVDLARQKVRFDCGRWPNYRLISPKGTCPVDSKSLELWEWQPPTTY